MTHAIRRMRAGCKGAALVGDPGCYGRFGFRAFPGLRSGEVPVRFVQALPFDGSEPRGELIHHPAFDLDQRGCRKPGPHIDVVARAHRLADCCPPQMPFHASPEADGAGIPAISVLAAGKASRAFVSPRVRRVILVAPWRGVSLLWSDARAARHAHEVEDCMIMMIIGAVDAGHGRAPLSATCRPVRGAIRNERAAGQFVRHEDARWFTSSRRLSRHV